MNKVEELLASFIPPPRSQRANYDLERVTALMNQLGNPQNSYPVIHVAGTSGKTSTCYYLSELFRSSGYKTGLTVSPHIASVGERLQINGVSLPDEKFLEYFAVFSEQVDLESIKPTYFEVLVAFAYWYFAYMKVDIAVVETGIGGLLDATNIITNPSKTCVITDIGIDHTQVLGNSIAEITAQKAGIIMPGSSVYMLQQNQEIEQIIETKSASVGAKLCILDEVDQDLDLPLFQNRNFSLSVQVARDWLTSNGKVLSDEVVATSSNIQVPGRMEIFKVKGKTIVLDGAHNPQKLNQFVRSFKAKFPNQKPVLVCAMLASGEIRVRDNVEQLLKLEPAKVFATEFVGKQDLKKASVAARKLAEEFISAGYNPILLDSNTALKRALQESTEVIVLTGSFYLLFDLRPDVIALQG
ncbi:MAG: Mur ligase family protein [bacterium]|nr:Mur ligase family protein [bacterium]